MKAIKKVKAEIGIVQGERKGLVNLVDPVLEGTAVHMEGLGGLRKIPFVFQINPQGFEVFRALFGVGLQQRQQLLLAEIGIGGLFRRAVHEKAVHVVQEGEKALVGKPLMAVLQGDGGLREAALHPEEAVEHVADPGQEHAALGKVAQLGGERLRRQLLHGQIVGDPDEALLKKDAAPGKQQGDGPHGVVHAVDGDIPLRHLYLGAEVGVVLLPLVEAEEAQGRLPGRLRSPQVFAEEGGEGGPLALPGGGGTGDSPADKVGKMLQHPEVTGLEGGIDLIDADSPLVPAGLVKEIDVEHPVEGVVGTAVFDPQTGPPDRQGLDIVLVVFELVDEVHFEHGHPGPLIHVHVGHPGDILGTAEHDPILVVDKERVLKEGQGGGGQLGEAAGAERLVQLQVEGEVPLKDLVGKVQKESRVHGLGQNQHRVALIPGAGISDGDDVDVLIVNGVGPEDLCRPQIDIFLLQLLLAVVNHGAQQLGLVALTVAGGRLQKAVVVSVRQALQIQPQRGEGLRNRLMFFHSFPSPDCPEGQKLIKRCWRTAQVK